MAIHFYSLDTPFHVKQKNKIKRWIKYVTEKNKHKCGDINFIFQSDEELLEVNKTHLAHDYYTDIITFNYSEGTIISGDLNISIDRIQDNASKFDAPFEQELLRVMIHGVLHLLGFNDKTAKEQKEMRSQENESLLIFNNESFT